MKVPARNSNSYHGQDFNRVPDCLALLDLGFVVLAVAVNLPEIFRQGWDHGL